MNSLEGAYFSEGHSTTRPPYFNGNHYSHWKARMKIFIQSTDYPVWNVIMKGPKMPTTKEGVVKKEEEWDEEDVKIVQTNARAINILYCALSGQEYDKISACETAKEMWDKLEVTHEGTSKVKESKCNMLVFEFELFHMKENESIEEMFTRFSKILGDLKALGKTYTQIEQVSKILRCLPQAWQSKVDTIESGNVKDLTYDELRGILIAYERTHLKRHEMEAKRKNLALKAGMSKPKEIVQPESSYDENDDEEEDLNLQDLAFFSKKLEKYARKKGFSWRQRNGSNRREIKKEDQGKNTITCYECGRIGHYKTECPYLKKKTSKFQHKKKAMAAWSDDDDDEEEEEEMMEKEMANLCFMALEDNEVSLENFDEDLEDNFDDLLENFQKLLSKCEILEKKNAILEKKLEKILQENKILTTKVSSSHSLEIENNELRQQIENLTKDLARFVKGEENLKMMLGKQKISLNRFGVGYYGLKNSKSSKTTFVKRLDSSSTKKCFHCSKIGHACYQCKKILKNAIWVPKGTCVSGNHH